MKQTVQNQKKANIGSTQKFVEIQDIIEDVIIFSGGSACLVIQIQASNFALLSKQEQDAKIYTYASLINSLSFPIQILIRNKAVDITSYLRLLDATCEKTQTTPGQSLLQTSSTNDITPMKLYRDFIQQLVSVKTVLDKNFYIIVSYSYLEKGVTSTPSLLKKEDIHNFFVSAKAALHTKAESLQSQLARLSLQTTILQKEELVKLFYDIYNPTVVGQTAADQLTSLTNSSIMGASNR